MDSKTLAEKFESFKTKKNEKGWNIHGMEIHHDDRLVHSFGDITSRFPIYSCTKTILSLAVGIAESEGKLKLEDSMLDYMPDSILEQISEHQRSSFNEITIERLLTMSVEDFPFRPQGDNWLLYALNLPVMAEKKRFNYSNICAYLASVVLTEATGVDSFDYISERILAPLGITDVPHGKSPEGYFNGGSTLELSVDELSLIGKLLMNGGIYEDKQIIPAEYVKEACSTKIMNREGGYGYFIWIDRNGFIIKGKWGQKCIVFPTDRLMITFLSDMPEGSSEPLAEILAWMN